MTRKTTPSMWSRRQVVAGLGGIASMLQSAQPAPQSALGHAGQDRPSLGPHGAFAQTGLVHKIVSEYYVERLNKNGGLLGRPVSYLLLDDQSKPDISRTLYERLITSDKRGF